MTPQFHSLKITKVMPEAGDAARISFEVPQALRTAYAFQAGQYLTFKAQVKGEALRRSYSLCNAVQDYESTGQLEVGVKRVDGGLFSNYILGLKRGDVLEVMTPEGKFGAHARGNQGDTASALDQHLVAFVAGSGITPVLSIMRSMLAASPSTRFTLIYGNRRADSVMFLEDLAALKNQYLERVRLYHVLSRQPQEVDLFNGRIDAAKVQAFTNHLVPISSISQSLICGPNSMIDEVAQTLLSAGLSEDKIHTERFGVPGEHRSSPIPSQVLQDENAPAAKLFVVLDGKRSEMRLPFGDGKTGAKVLDVALQQGLDLPFACKGGVCCTCRAKVLEGEVVMEKNYTLEKDEIAKGFVLTCQAMAKSEQVVISYDHR